jgi:hypothetical protein
MFTVDVVKDIANLQRINIKLEAEIARDSVPFEVLREILRSKMYCCCSDIGENQTPCKGYIYEASCTKQNCPLLNKKNNLAGTLPNPNGRP